MRVIPRPGLLILPERLETERLWLRAARGRWRINECSDSGNLRGIVALDAVV